jgi:hypothetical protein
LATSKNARRHSRPPHKVSRLKVGRDCYLGERERFTTAVFFAAVARLDATGRLFFFAFFAITRFLLFKVSKVVN